MGYYIDDGASANERLNRSNNVFWKNYSTIDLSMLLILNLFPQYMKKSSSKLNFTVV